MGWIQTADGLDTVIKSNDITPTTPFPTTPYYPVLTLFSSLACVASDNVVAPACVVLSADVALLQA